MAPILFTNVPPSMSFQPGSSTPAIAIQPETIALKRYCNPPTLAPRWRHSLSCRCPFAGSRDLLPDSIQSSELK